MFRYLTLGMATLIDVLAAVTPANAHRYANNPDYVVDRSIDVQFAPIGELVARTPDPGTTAKFTVGTGFLISPCYIMTAAHVPFGNDLTPKKGKDYTMTFHAGVSSKSAFAGNTLVTPVVAGERTIRGSNDWAIMKLAVCIGKRPEFGWFEAAHTSSEGMLGRNLFALGYPADQKRNELVIGAGTAVGSFWRGGLIGFTGSFAPGQSGGPVLIFENGMIKVAGICAAEIGSVHGATYPTFTYEHANLLQNAAEVLNNADITALLDADKAAFGQPNPAAERATRPLARTQMISR